MKIQLALQGGGARIVTLLAAASAIQELTRPDNPEPLEVTRVIGTSAGAIVGTLLAAGVNLDGFRDRMRDKLRNDLLHDLREPKKIDYVQTATFGKPLWNTGALKRILEDALQGVQAPGTSLSTLLDLKKLRNVDVRIVATNLNDQGPIVYSSKNPNTKIIPALMDSSAIPFYFRTWNHGPIVDGGVVQNLPWEDLADGTQAEFGPIYGLSFQVPPIDIERRRGRYGMALLEAAMASATERARSLLGQDRMCSLPYKYGTFDFKGAFSDEGLGGHYDSVKSATKQWFKDRLAVTEILPEDPWANQNISTMEKLGRMYQDQHASSKIKYENATFEIWATSLSKQGGPDTTRYSCHFRTLDREIYCHTIAMSQTGGKTFFKKSSLILTDSKGNIVPTNYLPILDPSTLEKREILVFFGKGLQPQTGPYTLEIHDTVDDLMGLFKRQRSDEMCLRAVRTELPIADVEILVHLPPEYNAARFQGRPKQQDADVVGEVIEPQVLRKRHSSPWPGWITLGWRGSNVPPTQEFGPMLII